MSILKVLMIGPGKPNRANSGLGIVAQHIAASLNSMVELTIIEPEVTEEVSKKLTMTTTGSFSETRVVKDIVRLAVKAKIEPYIYFEGNQEDEVSAVSEKSEVARELALFTDQVIVLANKQDFDIIYAHDWTAMPAALELKKKLGKPLVLHIHSLDVDRVSANHRSWVFDIEQEAIHVADAIISVSKYSAEIINRIYGGDPDKITVIYPAVAEEYEDTKGVKPLDPTVLFLGRFSNQKGPMQFIKIAESVIKKRKDIHFLMVGDGDLKQDAIEVVAQKGLSNNIHFNEFIDHDDIGQAFSRASVLCMPSYSDPYGLAAVEAASYGLPVVLSKNTGAAEVLPGALVFDITNISGFARGIGKLVDDQKYNETKVKENTAAVRKLGWEETAQKICNVFSSVKH